MPRAGHTPSATCREHSHLRGMNAVVHHMLDCTGFALFRQGISLFFPCFYADFDGFQRIFAANCKFAISNCHSQQRLFCQSRLF
jgi:hypothetical protein